MNSIKLNQNEIMAIIPHRDPMLLIDEVVDMVQGESITATFYIDPEREIFKGHFPGKPVLPGVYTTEIMAQASSILLLSLERYAGMIPYFVGIDKVRFMKKIKPGDTIEVQAKITIEKIQKGTVTCSAKVYSKGELACAGELTLAMR